MKFSMDGFRRQLSGDVERLKRIVASIVADEPYEDAELVDALNEVIARSNMINCVYDDSDPCFTDMSDVAVSMLEISEDA